MLVLVFANPTGLNAQNSTLDLEEPTGLGLLTMISLCKSLKVPVGLFGVEVDSRTLQPAFTSPGKPQLSRFLHEAGISSGGLTVFWALRFEV